MILPRRKEEDEAIWECAVPKSSRTRLSPPMPTERFPPPGKRERERERGELTPTLPRPKEEEDETIWECGVPKSPCKGLSKPMAAEHFPPPGKLGTVSVVDTTSRWSPVARERARVRVRRGHRLVALPG